MRNISTAIISGIYEIRCLPTGMVYVGSSSDIGARLRRHRNMLLSGRHWSKFLQQSWDKHGDINFTFGILELVTDVNAIVDREQYWINHFAAYKRGIGFNILEVAGSTRGRIKSDEEIAKISATLSGRHRSPETIAKMRAANIGKKQNPEWIAKRVAVTAARRLNGTFKKRVYSEAAKRQKSVAMKMFAEDTVHRARLLSSLDLARSAITSESRSRGARGRPGRKKDQNEKDKIGIASSIRMGTDEAKAKASEKFKAIWADPVMRQMLIDKRNKR